MTANIAIQDATAEKLRNVFPQVALCQSKSISGILHALTLGLI